MNKEEIKRIRTNAGLTQTEFGSKIGKSLRTVQNYEDGVTVPNARIIESIKSLDVQNISLTEEDSQYESLPGQYDLKSLSGVQITALGIAISKNLFWLETNEVFKLLVEKIELRGENKVWKEINNSTSKDTKITEEKIKDKIVRKRTVDS